MINFGLLIKTGYVVTIFSVILCWAYTRKRNRQLRETVDRFAFSFMKINNHVNPSAKAIRIITDGSGEKKSAKPLREQTLSVREICGRALDQTVIDEYERLSAYMELIEKKCGKSKKLIRQFKDPLWELYYATHLFLAACENNEILTGKDILEQFERYINGQKEYRHELFKRISAAGGKEFLRLSAHYNLFDTEGNPT